MWRSNTDVLQNWGRTMMEVESLATQGTISRPGAWSFPDCAAIGVAGEGSFTWNEARSVLALFAVTSSPIVLGNDPRPLQMQQRLVDLFLNKDMIQVDQQYHAGHAYAGGRIWSAPGGKEVWAKPLVTPPDSVAVVVVNKAGVAKGVVVEGTPLPPHCHDPNSTLGPCLGCFVNAHADSPCNDNVTASVGAQAITLPFSAVPAAWLGLAEAEAGSAGGATCDVFDIFATNNKGASLGSFTGSWSAVIPPHGSRFLRLSNCKVSA